MSIVGARSTCPFYIPSLFSNMSQIFGRFFGAPRCSRKDHVGRVRLHQSFETEVDTLDFWQLRSPDSVTVEMNALKVDSFVAFVVPSGRWLDSGSKHSNSRITSPDNSTDYATDHRATTHQPQRYGVILADAPILHNQGLTLNRL